MLGESSGIRTERTPARDINAADPGSGLADDTLTTFTHTFAEPMAFSTGVYFD